MPSRFCSWGRILVAACFWILAGAPLSAQTDHAHHDQAPATAGWAWSWDANVFAVWNYQLRKFTDFQELESQNWLMGAGHRPLGGGDLRLNAMVSLEPFTIQPLGSPQVFQTGETFEQAPLVDYQHPHDLIMGLGGTWTRRVRSARIYTTLALVGSPALGPPVFMHRPSAIENPTAPLGHHQLDATHITPGVITFGATMGDTTIDGSWFQGREPDENRKDLDLGPLDSWSLRARWQRNGWDAQVSGAHLTKPEWLNPFSDVTRLTASIGFTRPDGRLAALAAWGQNREVHGNLDAYLFEATYRPRLRHAAYTRAELVTKDILNPGRHVPGITHFHPLSRVGALTLGYVYDLIASPKGLVGIGGDITGYLVDENLQDNYGAPVSFHVFVRYRPQRTSHVGHFATGR